MDANQRKEIEERVAANTDRELWREIADDYYAPSIHVTANGGIGIDVGGLVFVRSLRDWHAAEARAVAAEDRVRELEPYAKFGRMFVEKVGMDDSWWGDEWSEDVMPLAVQAGIAERVPYDPEIHGEGVESEPGDEIWVWLPLKAQGSGE